MASRRRRARRPKAAPASSFALTRSVIPSFDAHSPGVDARVERAHLQRKTAHSRALDFVAAGAQIEPWHHGFVHQGDVAGSSVLEFAGNVAEAERHPGGMA